MKSKSVILCIFIVCLEVRVFGFPADVQLPLQQDNGQPKAVPKDPDAIVYPDQITRDSYGNPVTPFNDLGADHGIGHMTDINKNDKLDDRGNFEADKRDPSGFVIPSYASGIMKVETLLPPTAPKFPAVAPTKTDSSSSFNQIDVSDKILPPYREDEQKVKYPVIEVNTQATIFFPDSNFLNQIASHNHPNDLHKKPINSNAAVPQNTGSIAANIPVHNKPNNIVPVNTPLVPPTIHTPVKAPANNNGGDIYTGGFGGPPGILSTGNVNYQQPIKPPTAPQPTLGAPVQPQVVNKPANGGDIYSGGFGGSSGILSTGNVNYQQPIKPQTQPQPTLGAPVQVPVSNKPINGGDIYSGGFGGPSGVLNTGNANAQQPIKPPQTPVLQAPPQIPTNNNKVNSGDIYTGGFGGAQGFGGSSSNAQKPFNPPQAVPTFGTPAKVPTTANNDEIYTGGFGGAPGILGNSQNVGYGVKNPHAGNPIGHAPAAAPILPSSSLELPKIPSPPQPIAPVNSVPNVIQQQQSPPAIAPQPPTLLAPTSFQQGSFILDLNLLPPSLPPSSIASGSGSLSPLPKPAVVPPVSPPQLVPAVPQPSHHHHHHHQQQHHQHDRPIPSSSDIYQGGFGGAPGVLKPYDNAGHHH